MIILLLIILINGIILVLHDSYKKDNELLREIIAKLNIKISIKNKIINDLYQSKANLNSQLERSDDE